MGRPETPRGTGSDLARLREVGESKGERALVDTEAEEEQGSGSVG